MSLAFLSAGLGTTGLVDVGYRFVTAAGAYTGSRITAGVYEFPGARGEYGVATPTIPADAVGVYWNSAGSVGVYAYEFFDSRVPNINTSEAGAVLTAGTGTAQLSVTSGVASADMVAISGDAVAADRFETMLDGSGGNELTVFNLVIQNAFDTQSFNVNAATTLGGGVSLGSTLDIAGAVSFANNFSIAGGTTLTGAVLATNASNDIRGIFIAADGLTAASLATSAVNEITAATNVVLSGAHGSGPWGALPGTGPNAITVTVTDGSNPLQNASLGLYQLGVLQANGVTDVNGNITFSLATGTYQVVIIKANFQFTPVNRTVTGVQTGTLVNPLVMTQISPITPPVNPQLCNIYGFLIDPQGNPAANVPVSFTLNSPNGRRPITSNGNVINFVSVTAITDGAGFVSQDCIRTDVLDQGGCRYTIACVSANFNVQTKVDTPTLDISDL